jgi:valyl-tRNA synthetase
MSKSKGNVLDPLDIVDGIGLEALVAKRTTGSCSRSSRRRSSARRAGSSRTASAPTARCASLHVRLARNAVARPALRPRARRGLPEFLQQALERRALRADDDRSAAAGGPRDALAHDRGSVALAADGARVRDGFARFRFDLAAQALYEFTWYEFCDWYLEFSKPVLQSRCGSAERRAAAPHAASRRSRRCCGCCTR